MRFFTLLFVVLCVVAATFATPAGNKKQAPACSRDCGDKYEPVCAKEKNGKKLLTFGSECVMARYNCEHSNGEYEIKSKSECGGNVSVRLS